MILNTKLERKESPLGSELRIIWKMLSRTKDEGVSPGWTLAEMKIMGFLPWRQRVLDLGKRFGSEDSLVSSMFDLDEIVIRSIGRLSRLFVMVSL